MKTIETYKKIRETYPEMEKCFFSFNQQQFEVGKIEAGISDNEKVYPYNGGGGLFGTREGMDNYISRLDAISARIPKECDPQEVYDYEYDNHDCCFMFDDYDAIKIVTIYFGEDIAKTIKRRNAITDIDKLFY